jgi:hypothetical protein
MAIRKNENDTWEFLRDLTILSSIPESFSNLLLVPRLVLLRIN